MELTYGMKKLQVNNRFHWLKGSFSIHGNMLQLNSTVSNLWFGEKTLSSQGFCLWKLHSTIDEQVLRVNLAKNFGFLWRVLDFLGAFKVRICVRYIFSSKCPPGSGKSIGGWSHWNKSVFRVRKPLMVPVIVVSMQKHLHQKKYLIYQRPHITVWSNLSNLRYLAVTSWPLYHWPCKHLKFTFKCLTRSLLYCKAWWFVLK